MSTVTSSTTMLLCPWCGRRAEDHGRVPVFEGGVGAIICDRAPRDVVIPPLRVYRFIGTAEAQPWGEPYAARARG